MSTYTEDNRKVTTRRLIEMKQRGEKISMLTAYDYSMASLIDEAGMDVILVGDSASNVMAGNVTTLPMTLDQMIYHGKSVVRGVKRALVVVDMPFGTYQGNSKEALASAIRVMKRLMPTVSSSKAVPKFRSLLSVYSARYSYHGTLGSHSSIDKQIWNLCRTCQR